MQGEVRYLGRQRYGGVLGGLEEATCGPFPMLALDLGFKEALFFFLHHPCLWYFIYVCIYRGLD